MTSSNSALECCVKSLCSAPAAFLIHFDYASKVAWLTDLSPGYEPSHVPLCIRHAERFTAPVGWELVDGSSSAPPLFVETPTNVPDAGSRLFSRGGSELDGVNELSTHGSEPRRDQSRKARWHPSSNAPMPRPRERDGIRIRRARNNERPYDDAAGDKWDDGLHDDEHPSGPLEIHERNELPHVAREIERIAQQLATEAPDRFGPGSAFHVASASATYGTQMPLIADDAAIEHATRDAAERAAERATDHANERAVAFDDAFDADTFGDDAFGNAVPFEYDQTVVIDRYEVPGPMFLGDEDSNLRPPSGSLPGSLPF